MKVSQKRTPLATVAKGVAVVAASFVLAFSHAPIASAQTGWIIVGGTSGGIAGEARWNANDWLEVCDRAVDGNGVRAHVAPYLGSTNVSITPWAPSRGCIDPRWYSQTWQVFRVCAENIGCSGWYHR
ncbi:MAG TPA: hypothetical protein VF557_17805 [Jatrophihabitans sp.]|uniref:hypothetical protein n=1 Tax=Jatrophihabitans sp. TaxID=1932789 RepID=UPI002F2524BC